MTYDFKSFREFSQHNAELNHMKHRLKSPMTSDDRTSLEGQIADKTKTVMHHLNNLHQGKLQEDGVAAIGGSVGPTNVTGVATSTDPVSATAVNMKKKKKTVLMSIRRKNTQ